MSAKKTLRERFGIPENAPLYVDSYSPGDGVTRYRFFRYEVDYFAGDGIYTALGYKEAATFVRGFLAGCGVDV